MKGGVPKIKLQSGLCFYVCYLMLCSPNSPHNNNDLPSEDMVDTCLGDDAQIASSQLLRENEIKTDCTTTVLPWEAFARLCN